MSTFFAAVFPTLSAAEEAQRIVEKLDGDHLMRVVSSVVISKSNDGEISQHHGRTPGPLAAGLGGLVGGLLGLIGGPLVAMVGAAGGAISGGWFDLLRVEERDLFLNEVARKIHADQSALLCEVINPSDEAKRTVERHLSEIGGTLIGRQP